MNLQGRNLKRDLRGDDVALLHRELAMIGLTVPDAERAQATFGPGTFEAVVRFQTMHSLEPTGVVEAETADAINAAVDAVTFVVEGKVSSRTRAGVDGLRVTIVDKNVAEDVPFAEAVTDEVGSYKVRFIASNLQQRGKQRLDLQARVHAGETFLGASEVRYNASNRETLNVLLTETAASSLPSEHETLAGTLAAHFQGNLRDLQETDDRQDITYLANKTGWDARAVALAALADQFSKKSRDASGAGIEPAFFYALFRGGLPANEDALYRTNAKIAAGIWRQAIEQGVIPAALGTSVPQAVRQFQRIAAQRALDGPAPVGLSPLREMLSVSLVDDPANQRRFAELYALHQGDPPQFWEAVRGAFGESAEQRLRLDGQLAYLALNNAPLIRKLHDTVGQNGLTDTANLAESGYYRAQRWQALIGDGAIPPEIPGEEKRSRYAEVLAAQVRLSFPTAVVAQMVKSGETPVADGMAHQIHAFLSQHQGKFEIGLQPIEQYLKRNSVQVAPDVVREITRIQRVYQITPSDGAMNALLKRGIDSAYAVTRYSRDQFVRTFSGELGGEANARLVHAKSQQVHNLVLNVAFSYLTAGIAPAIGVHSPPNYMDPAPKGSSSQAANAGDVIAYPTLEGLFGELDFCDCEHCRSLLSPAAYLVDLLLFLDRKNDIWTSDLANWKSDHGNAPYPFAGLKAWNDAGNPADTEITPLQVLLERRPDIQHLPLTCENTNTPLPYIDLVNETLEYFIANKTENLTLKGYTGHTVDGDAKPEELLANPQFVREEAYSTLLGARFPPPLPFHQPLENLRRYFDRSEAPLPGVMEALRQNDNLERPAPADPTNPVEYGWRDILMEELRLSRAEHKILTNYDPDPPVNAKLTLQQLYGYAPTASEADVLGGLLFSIGLNFITELDKGQVSQTLRQVFEQHGKVLTQQSQAEVKKAGINWTIVDAFTYDIRNENQTLNVYLIALSNAKAFTRRVGISYEDIIEILRTRFVNPSSTLIPKLERLGVPLSTIKALKDGDIASEKFGELLPAGLNPAAYSDDPPVLADDGSDYAEVMGSIITTWVTNAYDNIMGLITLANPTEEEDLCSFDNVEFRYADPDKIKTPIRAFEFVRLIRFIRLWKKLGWTIEQTDKAITALYPVDLTPDDPDDAVNLQRLDAGFLILLPRLGVLRRVMRTLKLKPKKDLLPLLACFAPIDTHGTTSLYRQMFLNPTLLKQDDAFADNGYGEFLRDTTKKLAAHAEALRSAFNLTGEELFRIATDLDFKILLQAPYTHPQSTLEQAILSTAPGIGYDDLKKQLSYAGVLSVPTRDALKAITGVSQQFKDAVDALYAANSSLTGLNIPNISAIFRRGWLARKLKLSVRELRLLAQFSAIDPFASPDPPNPPILALIEMLNRLRAASLKPVEALYLIWNQDISGRSVPADQEILDFARTLRSAFTAIESEFTLADDPDGSIARARMAQVYGNEATDHFFGLLDNKVATDVDYSQSEPTLSQAILDAASGHIAYDNLRKRLSYDAGVMPEATRDALKAASGATVEFGSAVDGLYAKTRAFFDRYPELLPLYEAYIFFGDLRSSVAYTHPQTDLEQAILDVAPGRITYDDLAKRLAYIGVLPEATRDALKAVAGVTPQFQAAVDSLYGENQDAIQAFFADQPELASEKGQKDAYLTANDSVERRRTVLLASFLPELKRRRKRQQALQVISAAAQADAGLTSAMLDDARVLHAAGNDTLPASVDPTTLPALDDLTALEIAGLSVQFFFADSASGIPSVTRDAVANLAYTATGVNKLPPNGNSPADAISGIWSGYFDAPENGFYNLRIEADLGAEVTLILDDKKVEFLPPQSGSNTWVNKEAIELLAGTLYPVVLTVEKVKDTLTVRWETTGRGREVIPPRHLYSQTLTDHLRAAYIRFLKAVSLATSLRLSTNEIAHFATKTDYLINGQGWLNSLAVSGSPDDATSEALLKAFTALLHFARIKAELSPSDERLLAVLKDPEASAKVVTENVDSLLFSLTRWESGSLDALLARFENSIAHLAHIETFQRIYDAFLPVKKLRVPASALIDAATNEPSATAVRNLQAALRARYDESDWLNVLQPINDQMRSLQRDALVAYILHHMRENPATAHIDTADKLFEYFLMDVQMDPCMQTSRIRHALSSVQLFIERCFMNLEPRVAPSVLEPQHWEWMKRYRVWEANRKVWLQPENWLEPELRDDQSPFCKEAMSELLQSDITEDRATVALGNYLSKLEEVAKLEPCGIYYIEGEPGISPAVAHVVARTAGAGRKYYYRRRDGADGPWTPWEQIKLDIEDNPVIPVVWKDRLFLFWLRILKQAPLDPSQQPQPEGTLSSVMASDIIPKEAPTVTVQAVLCWSEYYNGKWQATKTSDVNRPARLYEYTGADSFERSDLTLLVFETKLGALRVFIGCSSKSWSCLLASFLLHNTHSSPVPENDPPTEDVLAHYKNHPERELRTGPDIFDILYYKNQSSDAAIAPKVLKNEIDDRTIEPRHRLQSPWEAPFFYGDSRHVFYVTTERAIKPAKRWDGYLQLTEQDVTFARIPPLVLAKKPPPGPSPIERFVSEDAYINKWIATTGMVRYDGIGIGPAGGIHVSSIEGE